MQIERKWAMPGVAGGKEMIPFPRKKYNIIYADPPWTHTSWENGNRRPERHYPVMSTEDIKALPVKDIADDNCILFMWVTPPHIKEGLDVIEAWGFQYKTFAFTWVKLNKKQPTLFMGCGSWTRANSEICLLATKGKPKRVSASVRQVILSPREEHSKKPDETRERIIELVGDLPRIELFARQQVTGWDCWGDEIPEEVISWQP